MTKKTTAFDGYYDTQETWIIGQLENFKHDSFVDLYIAKKEIEDAGITAFATPEDLKQFRDKHLSQLGRERLSSSLRTHKTRQNRKLTTRRLDMAISLPAYLALESLVKELGLTKIELIEQLVLERREKQNNECDTVTQQ